MWAILVAVLIVIVALVLPGALSHTSWTTHAIDVDGEASSAHVLPGWLSVVEHLLRLPIRRKLVALLLLSSWLAMRSPEYLAIEIHLNARVALQLDEDVLHIVHDV